MHIEVWRFADEIKKLIKYEDTHWEIRLYGPSLVEQAKKPFNTQHPVQIGQRILMHHFGEILAARFKKWIDMNYEIGSDDREWSSTGVVVEEMAA